MPRPGRNDAGGARRRCRASRSGRTPREPMSRRARRRRSPPSPREPRAATPARSSTAPRAPSPASRPAIGRADPARSARDDGERSLEEAHASPCLSRSSSAPGSPAAQSTSTITSSTPAAASSPQPRARSALRPADSTIRSTTCNRSRVAAGGACRVGRGAARAHDLFGVELAERLLPEPAVADRAGAPQGGPGVSADQDGHVVGGRRQAENAGGQRVVVAVVGRGRPGPARAEQRHPLLEAGTARLERDVERVELLPQPAGADAEPEPSAAGDVDRGELLRDDDRLTERQHEHRRPEGDPLGRAGGERERDQRVEIRASRTATSRGRRRRTGSATRSPAVGRRGR